MIFDRSQTNRGASAAAIRALAAGCALLIVALGAAADERGAGSRIEISVGQVEVGHGEPPQWRPGREGEKLAPGEIVRTGRNGRAEIRMGAGTVRLFENSVLRLPEAMDADSQTERVRMDEGTSLFEIIRRKTGHRFEVESPEVVVSVKGTRFAVMLEPGGARVQVMRGPVGVRAPGGLLDGFAGYVN